MAEACRGNSQAVLRPVFCELANQLDVEVILPFMKDVLGAYHTDRILAEKTSFKRNERLISTVSKLGPNALTRFLMALDQFYPHLALQIRQGRKQLPDQPRHFTLQPIVQNGTIQPKVFAPPGKNHSKVVVPNMILNEKRKYLLRKDATKLRDIERGILRRNRMNLCRMDEERVLSLCSSLNNKYNVENIRSKATHRQKVEALLDILVKCGPDAFEEFVNAVTFVNPDLGLPIVEELKKHDVVCDA